MTVPATVVVDTPHRLSVSEPVGGYTAYEHTPHGAVTYSAATETYSETIDIPFDFQRSQKGGTDGADATKLINDGTYPNFRIIYLQRLADPTRQYNPVTGGNASAINSANPYRTVDSMSVDLTSFNGVVDRATNTSDPNNTKPTGTHFEARQRGNAVNVTGEFNLWKQDSYNKTNWATNPGTTPTGYFPNGLTSSLGYLNAPFQKSATTHRPDEPGQRLPGRPARAVSLAELGLSAVCERV